MQDGAYADVTVKAGIIRLLHKEFDVCEEAYVVRLTYFESELVTCSLSAPTPTQAQCEHHYSVSSREGSS